MVDDLLDPALAAAIAEGFPALEEMDRRSTLRERKRIGIELDRYDPLCREVLYAFQDRRVVSEIAAITGIDTLHPDAELYAGGLSSMSRGDFLHPHLDNSHDSARERYRVLNLLYYASPGWQLDRGGNLELWDGGPSGAPRVIESRFNRLVIMATGRRSWHSVQPVVHDGRRDCVSNYYFSPRHPDRVDYFHPTVFRARPGHKLRDAVLRLDGAARTGLRRVFARGVRRTTHLYRP